MMMQMERHDTFATHPTSSNKGCVQELLVKNTNKDMVLWALTFKIHGIAKGVAFMAFLTCSVCFFNSVD